MEFLKSNAKSFGIDLNENQLNKFKIYMDYLLEYNSHTNLTAIKAPNDIMIKHFLDSIVISKYVNIKDGSKIIDVGTGAGFPGVPLKIYNPNINLTLIDSLNKRIIFLNNLMSKIESDVDIYHARAEELSLNPKFREKFDFSVSRAVASLNILAEYCLPYVKKGGFLVALKGPEIEEEIKSAEKIINILGGELKECHSFELPLSMGTRSLVVIEKKRNTPKGYPRKNSKIRS